MRWKNNLTLPTLLLILLSTAFKESSTATVKDILKLDTDSFNPRVAREDKFYLNRYGSNTASASSVSKRTVKPDDPTDTRTTTSSQALDKRCIRCQQQYNRDPYDPYRSGGAGRYPADDYRYDDRYYDDRRYDRYDPYSRDRYYDRGRDRYDPYEKYDRSRDRDYYYDRERGAGYDRGAGYERGAYERPPYDRGIGYDNRGYDYRDYREYRERDPYRRDPYDDYYRGGAYEGRYASGYDYGRDDFGRDRYYDYYRPRDPYDGYRPTSYLYGRPSENATTPISEANKTGATDAPRGEKGESG